MTRARNPRFSTPALLLIFGAALSAVSSEVSCGGDSGSGGGGGGKAGGSTNSNTGGTGGTTSDTGGGGSTSSGGGGTDVCLGDPGSVINDCMADGTGATDMTGMGPQTIVFGDTTGFAYDPKCLIVNSDQTVTFDGDFTIHPLDSGEIRDAIECEDKGPLKFGATGPKTFTLPAGTYPFFCEMHGPGGMDGLIIVKDP